MVDSLINALPAQPVSLDGSPCIGTFAVFHGLPIFRRWMEQCSLICSKLGILFPNLILFKELHNFLPDLSAVFLGLHDAVVSLMFSNKPLRTSYKNCFPTDIRLHDFRRLFNVIKCWV
ncbi:hypothetical protein XENORESO_017986 [Xenotaenia resolanae]|uniref:Uncharacterized protein n=1 Tax=Xenotaenia resolanae TaxID=208358 RepID=A0ABV0X972_9TELE